MDSTSQECLVNPFFGGSDMVAFARGRVESCLNHFEWGEDPGVNEPIQGFSAHNLY